MLERLRELLPPPADPVEPGRPDGWAEVEANLIHYNELVLSGASDSRRRDYDTALRLIESGRVATPAFPTIAARMFRTPLTACSRPA